MTRIYGLLYRSRTNRWSLEDQEYEATIYIMVLGIIGYGCTYIRDALGARDLGR